MTEYLVLRNARIDGALRHVHITDGMITAIEPASDLDDSRDVPASAATLDLAGRVVRPPFVNAHAHLDKTFWSMPWQPHLPGATIRQCIDRERSIRAAATEPQLPRSLALATRMIEAGVGVIRSHIDVDTLVGLGGVETLVQVREKLAGLVDLQLVAFPQSGIRADPGVADLMDEAMRSGVDVVGGLDPHGIDGDVDGHLDVVFGLAEKYHAPIDIHLHDEGPDGLAEIAQICERTIVSGMQGNVTISHAYALGSATSDAVAPVIARLAEAGICIMTDGPVGMTPPVLRLHAAGVPVISGSDGIRDAWSPYGVPAMAPIATQLAYQSRMYDDADFELVADIVSIHGSRVVGVDGHGLEVGCRGDLNVFDATAVAEIVAESISPTLVLRGGRVVPPGPSSWPPLPVTDLAAVGVAPH
ncbi:cytosine deaminase [Jatrophihabitans sp. GAS493]|uniref:amidohydrolase n=1 Tax=Jatrophihabitans sp. GAS493 TaxID=1907575 RepID=UPI000BB6A0BA|nr:amidohydrolase [Jatrophihabitans sp. GAS493]SOD70769.1 cytosine deaminase [Jatrophihabitans sp. GAS493]